MSDPIESKNPEFLVELSEPEQESVAGGFALEDMFESFSSNKQTSTLLQKLNSMIHKLVVLAYKELDIGCRKSL